ncbi:GIY-YIG nuclease family protein [Caldithrix abyssi]|uniref:Excinuclease ABC C subunit domain protein n=1 Tax=Caldithrix abyssi DSM 13497 TaxID=880073 RepID=H1XPM0_CALAY|nr:GIY-YIG nuclease family protein [Caldithrix abyssi]APF19845.1 putative endonuclease [Caldithrix abyssi DSM 13497]EHO39941.1 Excinuclease ABC C subunit domain protein [Caldithrix abyssi DSM 13497]
MYYTYVLESLASGRHYFGHTQNLEERLTRHNSGKVRSTKAFRPWRLIYYEEFATRSEAFQREQFFKTIEGRQWLKGRGIL